MQIFLQRATQHSGTGLMKQEVSSYLPAGKMQVFAMHRVMCDNPLPDSIKFCTINITLARVKFGKTLLILHLTL